MLTFKSPPTRIEVVQAGKGRDLLFLHGAGGHMPNDPLLAALATKYRVSAPLLPGYGRSEGEEGLRDMLDVTLHALDVLEKLKLKKPIVVGHSMGGMIAAEMAAIAHTEIEKLCLLAPAGLWLDDHPIVDIFAKLPYELPALLFHDAEAGRQLLTAGGGDMGDIEFLKQFLVINARRLGMAGKLLFPIPDRGLAGRLHRITAKTLIVWGREDVLIPPVYGDAFKRGDFEIEAGKDRQGRPRGRTGEAGRGAQGDPRLLLSGGGAMRRHILLAIGLAVLGAGAALADPALYTLTGMGTGVAGTSKCATYQITIDLAVDGKAVKGSFKQQGRPERLFTATLDDKGAFKTRADVGDGNTMDVSGTVGDKDGRILLDGYCKFEGKLTRT